MGGGQKRRRKRAKGGKKGPPLSLCMIVKDEADRLGRCLESLAPLKPEIIVVDTGSTDGTQEVARRFGARVISFPWRNDFSAARNRSLKEAKGRWILILDADETLAAEDLPRLRKLLQAPGVAAYSIVTRNYSRKDWMAGWQPCQGQYPEMEDGLPGWFPSEKIRLFKRHPAVRFEGAVHEMVESSVERMGGRVVPCPVPVHHFGPADEESRRAKARYYLRLVLKKLRQERDDPQGWIEAGSHLFELGRFRWAGRAFQRVVELHERSSRPSPASAQAAVQALNMLGALAPGQDEAQEAVAFSRRALQIEPDFAPSRHNLDAALKHLGQESQGDTGKVSVSEETAITLCMIVRNEEEDLPGCLEDFGPVADQIVVVDTGSDDDTVAVARRYGAEVHHHPWQDDFSEARNWSLHYARGRMIVWADADDRLEPGAAEALRREVLANEGKAIYCVLQTLEVGGVTRSYQLRAFPNRPDIRFEGRIHEQVAWAVERLGLPSAWVPVEIIHTGYADAEATQRKLQRNRTMLEEQIRRDPDDLYAHYMLARTLEGLGDKDAAAQWYSRLLAHPEAKSGRYEFILHAQTLLAQHCCYRGEVDEGRRLSEDLVARRPEFALGRLLLGELAFKTGSFLEACEVLSPLVDEEVSPSLIPVNPDEIVHKAGRYRGAALMGLGRWKEATVCLERALEIWSDEEEETLFWLGESLFREGRLDEAGKAFERVVDLHEGSSCSPPVSDQAAAQALTMLGVFAMERGRLSEAVECFERALQVDPDAEATKPHMDEALSRLGKEGESDARSVLVDPSCALSLCMIVKDEEANLPGCLESFGPVADQIVVIDTGSTDRTPEVARSYGAEVYHHPWKDDFSEARNWSLRYAKGRMVLWVDADDRLKPGTAEALRRELLAHEGKTIYLLLRSPLAKGGSNVSYQIRAFPNHPLLRFVGRIYERVAGTTGKLIIPGFWLPLEIIHTGYSDGESLRQKLLRNKQIMEEGLQQRPDDVFAQYMLARTLEELGDTEASAQWDARVLAHPNVPADQREILLYSQAYLATHYCRKGNVKEGRKLLEELVSREPWFYLGRLCLGELALKTGSHLEACQVLLPLLENKLTVSTIPFNQEDVLYRANRHIGAALLAMGQWNDAKVCLERALALRPDDQETLPLLAETFMLEGRLEEAEEAFLACEEADPTVRLHLGTIALRRDDLDAAEERFGAAASEGLDSAPLHNNLGLLMDRRGRWGEAEHHYKRALEKHPNMVEPLLNLGHGLLNQGRWDEAGDFFRRALALEPELLDARLAAAALAFSNGDVDRARTLAGRLWQELAPDGSTPQPPPSDPSSLFVQLGERLRGQDPLVELCDRLATGLTR